MEAEAQVCEQCKKPGQGLNSIDGEKVCADCLKTRLSWGAVKELPRSQRRIWKRRQYLRTLRDRLLEPDECRCPSCGKRRKSEHFQEATKRGIYLGTWQPLCPACERDDRGSFYITEPDGFRHGPYRGVLAETADLRS